MDQHNARDVTSIPENRMAELSSRRTHDYQETMRWLMGPMEEYAGYGKSGCGFHEGFITVYSDYLPFSTHILIHFEGPECSLRHLSTTHSPGVLREHRTPRPTTPLAVKVSVLHSRPSSPTCVKFFCNEPVSPDCNTQVMQQFGQDWARLTSDTLFDSQFALKSEAGL
ncbi:hypothetical protein D9619_003846 [Psilocybe cf. subviscida]|uniref:Uncharacterized protein n=1 Tax=Psilocybe cf. subviscida TaxID=2480587 RepID=A0A8H5ETQ6_9AGAR|nr:hypothetical protein D9619_003846 [Psilocybe cf. subviscida]